MTDVVVDRTLANGCRLLVVRHGVTPLVETRLVVRRRCSSRAELASSTLLAGCLAQRPDEVSAAADAYQMSVARSGSDVGALAVTLREVIEGVTGEPGPARGDLISRLRVAGAHPDHMARARLGALLFGGHPAGFVLTAADVATAHVPPGGWSLPSAGAVLTILASDGLEHLADMAEQVLSGWPHATVPPPLPPVPALPLGRVERVRTPGSPQARIRLRAPALPVTDPRYAELLLAANVLGASLSSRLQRNLREDKGYAYNVRAFFDARAGSTMLAVEAETATATTEAALDALRAELRRMEKDPPSAAEIDLARAFALGSTATRLASSAAMATALADLAAREVDPRLLFGFSQRLREAPAERVVLAAREFFDPDRFVGVIAADVPSPLSGPGIGPGSERERNQHVR